MRFKYVCTVCGSNEKYTDYRLKREYICSSCRRKLRKEYDRERNEAKSKKNRLIRERGSRCEICGVEPEIVDIHHKTPLAAGGTGDDENLILLCEDCHKKQHKGQSLDFYGWIQARKETSQ